jgi:hypothetical protein
MRLETIINGKMIDNPNWLQPEERAYFHQISPDCISKLAEVVATLSNGEIDIENAFRMYELYR